MHCRFALVAFGLTLGLACDATPGETGPPGFLQLHAEVFEKSCTSAACHSGDKGVASLSFSDPVAAYEHLLNDAPSLGSAKLANLGLVVPGSPEESLLYLKLALSAEELQERDLGAAMPMSLGMRAGPKLLQAVYDWIAQGAPMEGAQVEADWTDLGDVELYVPCEATDEAGLRACLGQNPDPEKFIRLYTPPMEIPPGAEKIFCSFVDTAADEIRLKKATGHQMAGGHHVAIFESLTAAQTTDAVDCDEISMGSLRFVAGAGGAGGATTILPQGIGLTIPKGRHIVIQSHYINVTPATVVVMDAVDLELTTLEESPVTADPFTVIDSEFEIPQGAENYTRVKECLIDKPIEVHMLLGHTHDYGVLFTVDIIKATGPQADLPQQMYHATDGPTLRDTPEVIFFDESVKLEEGDRLVITCAWTNTTDHALKWPEEMCVALMYYSPGQGFMMCDTNDITPKIDSGGSGEGCLPPGTQGNEKGVGKYCTAGGGECDDTPEPTMCLVEFDASANYCSVILCSTDEECGSGAICQFADAGSACLPAECVD